MVRYEAWANFITDAALPIYKRTAVSGHGKPTGSSHAAGKPYSKERLNGRHRRFLEKALLAVIVRVIRLTVKSKGSFGSRGVDKFGTCCVVRQKS